MRSVLDFLVQLSHMYVHEHISNLAFDTTKWHQCYLIHRTIHGHSLINALHASGTVLDPEDREETKSFLIVFVL